MKNIQKLSMIALVFSLVALSFLSFVLAESNGGVTFTPSSSNINQITISDISIPSSIVKGSSGSLDVLFTNSGNDGMFVITPSSDQLSINPSAQNLVLSNQTTVHYTFTAQNSASSGKVCVKVCTTNQFGDNGCTDQCKLFSIVENVPSQSGSSNNSIIIAVIIAVAVIIGFIILAIVLSRRNKK